MMFGSGDAAIYPRLDEEDLPRARPVDWQALAYQLEDENARLRREVLAVTGKPAADVRDRQRTKTVLGIRLPGMLAVTEVNGR